MITLQAIIFAVIALNFVVCVLAVIRPWLIEAFRKPVRHEAVILQLRPRVRRGRFHG
jgi:hypothetical protein